MKRALVLASIVILGACGCKNADKIEPAKPEAGTAQEIKSPYEVLYSSKFEMGNPKNAEAILMLWKDWDNGDLSVHKDLFADSVELYFADGGRMHSSRDSVMAGAQKVRSSMTSSVSQVHAVMAVRSTDKNEDWALIW